MSEIRRKAFNYNALINPDDRAALRKKSEHGKAILKRTAQGVWDMGRILTDAKEILGHGHFTEWIAAEFDLSESSARRFMRVFEHFKTVTMTDLDVTPTILYLLSSPSVTDETREVAIEMIECGDLTSASDTKVLIEAGAESTSTKNEQGKTVTMTVLEGGEEDELGGTELDLPDDEPAQDEIVDAVSAETEGLQQRAASAAIVHDTITPTSAPQPDTSTEPDENDLTDAEWLNSLPLVRYFAASGLSMVLLKKSLLSWRSLHQAKAFSQFKHHAAKAINFKEGGAGALESVVYEASHLPHPRDWKLCAKCKGRSCTHCRYAGYALHEGAEVPQ